MAKAGPAKKKMFTVEQLIFFVNCVKKRASTIELDYRSKDSFVKNSKILAWEDIKEQLYKRYSKHWTVPLLRRKWQKVKYESKRQLRSALSEGGEMKFNDWVTITLEVLGIDTQSVNNLQIEELDLSHLEQAPDQEFDSEMNESDDLNKSNIWLGENMDDPPTPPAVVCELKSSDYDYSSRNVTSDANVTHNHNEASTSNCESNVNCAITNVTIEEETNFRKQLYEETLERLRQEHQLKMDVLKLQLEEERVKLDILKIQREEAQRRIAAMKNEKLSSEQWYSEIRNNNEDFNNCPNIE